MVSLDLSLFTPVLLSGTAACLVWTVRMLWGLDRRVSRIETELEIKERRIKI